MAEIKVYNTAIAHQEEAFGFHKVAVAEMAKCKDAKFAPVYQIYKAAYDTFDNALKQGGGEHALSQPIVAQDTVCDKLYRGLTAKYPPWRDSTTPPSPRWPGKRASY